MRCVMNRAYASRPLPGVLRRLRVVKGCRDDFVGAIPYVCEPSLEGPGDAEKCAEVTPLRVCLERSKSRAPAPTRRVCVDISVEFACLIVATVAAMATSRSLTNSDALVGGTALMTWPNLAIPHICNKRSAANGSSSDISSVWSIKAVVFGAHLRQGRRDKVGVV